MAYEIVTLANTCFDIFIYVLVGTILMRVTLGKISFIRAFCTVSFLIALYFGNEALKLWQFSGQL